MKIGILTLPLRYNYGGLLQVYALQLYLSRRGHEVIVIDRQFNSLNLVGIKTLIKKLFFPSKLKSQIEEKIIHQNTNYFIKRYINPKTESFYSSKALKKGVKKYNFDTVLVGSDQVWRTSYTNKMVLDYFLNFIDYNNVKKISYAASFGVNSWSCNDEITKKIKPLLKKFQAVSVREDSGISICSSVFEIKALRHIDPTLLLSIQDYQWLVENENESGRKESILVYMLDIDKDKQRVIDQIAFEKNGTTFSINKPILPAEAPLKDKIEPKVTSWLSGFFDASFVITDSFHGTIFALLHNKPFIVYGNVERGLARFYSILKSVGLEHRIVLNSEELTVSLIEEEIDWKIVNSMLEKERQNTDNYFKSQGI